MMRLRLISAALVLVLLGLWTFADSLWFSPARDVGAAERAVRLAPMDGAAWLLLADRTAAGESNGVAAAAMIKMSYYTRPADLALLRDRLRIAAGSAALADKDIQDFVRHDIELVLKRKPALRPAIVAAYRDAAAQNKPILMGFVRDADPTFAQQLPQ